VNFVYFLILIGFLIFFHELGHFLAAKAFGVKVLRFALGFGRPIVNVRWGETDYSINWFPLGGYVRMLGQEPAELRSPDEAELPPAEAERAFDRKPRWQRLLIILAGPVFNLVLPLPIYFFFFFGQATLPPATVGSVTPEGPAWQAGIRPGDRIVSIDGTPLRYWEEMEARIVASPGTPLRMEVVRAEQRLSLTVVPEERELSTRNPAISNRKVGRIGVTSVFLGAQVAVLDPRSPAAMAGLRAWDLVAEAAGQPVRRWVELEEVLRAHAGQRIPLVLRRLPAELEVPDDPAKLFEQGEALRVELDVPPAGTPESAGLRPAEFLVASLSEAGAAARAGLLPGDLIEAVDGSPCTTFGQCLSGFHETPEQEHTVRYLRPSEEPPLPRELRFAADVERRLNEVKQEEIHAKVGLANRSLLLPPEPVPNERRAGRAFVKAFAQDWEMIRMNAVGLVMLASCQISPKSVGGPIMIFDLTSKAAKRGLEEFLWLLTVISINLGLINLLPIPILDGGQATVLGIESVMRGPLSLRVRTIAAYVGLALVILLMGFAFKNDIERYWGDFVRWLP